MYRQCCVCLKTMAVYVRKIIIFLTNFTSLYLISLLFTSLLFDREWNRRLNYGPVPRSIFLGHLRCLYGENEGEDEVAVV